ncbi:MAG: archaemetzincin family Zn-dependent metalloprotease [Gemmatimonadota bacterium]|nr:archaemetzincin family Zn-dependent metalloprotease [Gemmatimonadota bacterium]
MSAEVLLAFLNGYRPAWQEELRLRVGRILAHPVRTAPLSIDLRDFHAPERAQFHATLLLAELLRHLPEGGGRIVGITDVDLYIPVLTFVFGQAQLSGPAAVVSVMRLHNEYYGLPGDETLLLERAVKEVVHELGHGLGLVHCPDYACVMSSSTSVEDVDLKAGEFCPACRDLLADRPAVPS